MGKIRGMRALSDADKLSFRSIPEVFEFINDLAGKLRGDKSIRLVFKGKPKAPPRAAIANAIIVRVMTMTAEQRRQFISEGMTELNRLLRLDAPEAEVLKNQPVAKTVTGRENAALSEEMEAAKGQPAKRKAPKKGRK